MIVLDTSALLAILLREPDIIAMIAAIAAADRAILPSPAYVEASLRIERSADADFVRGLDRLIDDSIIEVAAFTVEHARAAREAIHAFGKGRHPAALNFGDCMVYAVAKLADAPLLFKGGDFALTDIRSVL